MTVNQMSRDEDLRDAADTGRAACFGAPRPGGGVVKTFFAMVPFLCPVFKIA